MALIPNTPEIPFVGAVSLAGPDWKQNYRQGSFRGVQFKTKSHKFVSGRHDVEHEFPSKEEGNSEDVGKRLPKFNLELYVLGDDYFDQRDALIEALDTEGAGELIHPYLGKKNVQVGKYTLTETVEEGRIARFSVEFTNAGIQKFPAEAADAVQAVLSAANAVLNKATAALTVGLNVVNAPARVALAAASLCHDAATRIENVAKLAGSSADGVAAVGYAIKNLKGDIQDLVAMPALLAARFVDAYGLLVGAVTDFKSLAKTISSQVSSFSPTPVIGGQTETVNLQRANQEAITNFILSAAVANSAQAAIQGNYASVDEALQMLSALNGDIGNLLPLLADDETFQSVKDMQVGLNIGLPPQNVGEIISYTPPKTLPALVISQKLFGNIDKESEIISQNFVKHPGFVPGGVKLEVSTDG